MVYRQPYPRSRGRNLATDLEEMATGIDCDAATKSILLNAVVMARFVNCEFEAALQVIDEIAAPTPRYRRSR